MKAAPDSKHLREKLNTSWAQLDSDYASWRTEYVELTRYLLPFSGRFFTQERNSGVRRTQAIYDNTATRALSVVGSGLMAGATSPARPWMRIVLGDAHSATSHAVKLWLEDTTQKVLRVFAKSNTYRVLHQSYEEVGGFGTAAFLALPHPETVIHCYPLTCGEYRLAQDWEGKVNTCYRRFERTVAETVAEFGYDNVSESVKSQWTSGSLRNPVVIVHVIEPRKDRDHSKLDAKNMPWKSVYYEEGVDEGRFLRESGFERFPVLAPRWSVSGGDVYGHGPGHEAIGDIKQLQHEQFRKSQGIDYMSNPPLQAPSALKGQDTNMLPGGITYVDAGGPQGGIQTAFEVRLDLQYLLADIQDVRERIRASFFADLFLMLSLAGTNTRMTATEVAERHEEKLIQLGPVLERLHTELLEPLVRIIFEELARTGQLMPTPPELEGAELSLEFISMLAQAQKAVGVASMERALNISLGIAQAKPDIMDNLDEDAMWREINDMVGVTPKITRSPEARDKLRAARAAAQNAQAQTEMMAAQAGAAKDLASAPSGPGTVLADVVNQFSGYNSPGAQSY